MPTPPMFPSVVLRQPNGSIVSAAVPVPVVSDRQTEPSSTQTCQP